MRGEEFKLKGSIKIERILPSGVRELLHEDHNLVVTTGKALGVSRLFSNSEFAVISAMGIGSGSVAPAVGDSALGNQLALQAFDAAATRSTNTETATTTFGPGVGTGSITEAGLFNGTANGSVMFSRSTFTSIPKAATDTIAVTWVVTAN